MSSVRGAHHEETGEQTQWMARSQDGDRFAYAELVTAFQDRLYNSILRIVGDRDEARDLTQDTFVKALEKIQTFRGECGPYTWFFKIAVNLSISHLRKLQRRRTFTLDQAAALAQKPADEVERNEEQQQILQALGRLDSEYRAILVMRDVEECDYQRWRTSSAYRWERSRAACFAHA